MQKPYAARACQAPHVLPGHPLIPGILEAPRALICNSVHANPSACTCIHRLAHVSTVIHRFSPASGLIHWYPEVFTIMQGHALVTKIDGSIKRCISSESSSSSRPWMSHEPAPAPSTTLDGPRVCDSDQEVPEAGLRGAQEAEGTAPRLLLVAQSVHDRDTEADPDAVQSDADDGRPSGNLSVSAGTRSDNIVLGSLPDGDEQGLSQQSGTTEKYTGCISSGSSDAGSTQNSASEDVEEGAARVDEAQGRREREPSCVRTPRAYNRVPNVAKASTSVAA